MLSSKTVMAVGRLNRATVLKNYSTMAPTSQALVDLPKAHTMVDLPEQHKRNRYPKIGNREIVGDSINHDASYLDMEDYPMPAVRWAPNTPEVLALREKEKGDWKGLSLQEKKQLYRNSYRQTFSEMSAPTGEWKRVLAITLYIAGFSTLCHLFSMYCSPIPETVLGGLTPERIQNIQVKDLSLNKGFATGLSSKYDFEKGQWK